MVVSSLSEPIKEVNTMNEKYSEILSRGKKAARKAFDKGNEIMDKVPFLATRTKKLVVWCCIAVAAVASVFIFFCAMLGSPGEGAPTPEVAVMRMYAAVKNGDAEGVVKCLYPYEPGRNTDIDLLIESMAKSDWDEKCSPEMLEITCKEPEFINDAPDGKKRADIITERVDTEVVNSCDGNWCLIEVDGLWFVDTERSNFSSKFSVLF